MLQAHLPFLLLGGPPAAAILSQVCHVESNGVPLSGPSRCFAEVLRDQRDCSKPNNHKSPFPAHDPAADALAAVCQNVSSVALLQGHAQKISKSSGCCMAGSGAYVPATGSMHQPGENGSIISQGADKAPQHIPATSYLIFGNVPKLEAIRSKLCEFNSMLSASPEKVSLTLGEADVAPGGTLDTVLARYDHASSSELNL